MTNCIAQVEEDFCKNNIYRNDYCRKHYKMFKDFHTDIYDASHPLRKKAIYLMEEIIGIIGKPKVFDGENWYAIEDLLTLALQEQKGEKQKGELCSTLYCNELNAVGGKCLEHYQEEL